MARLLESYPEQLILSIAVLATVLVAGMYVIGKIRAGTIQNEPQAGELLAKFQELHARGVLDDAEFRTIKTTLTMQLQEESKVNGEKG